MLFFVFFKIINSGNKYENFLIQITNVKIKDNDHSCYLR